MDEKYLTIMEGLQVENRELKEEIRCLHKELDDKESTINEQQEEIRKQQEEINELKEENQELRMKILGLKASKKRRRSPNTHKKREKRGPPFGHKGTSRKRPDRADTTVVLELEECPYCSGELKKFKGEI